MNIFNHWHFSDLTGSQDGSVQLWEWGHNTPVSTPRPPGTYAKVTRVRFSQHGNKFGVADSDGNLSLWQVGLTANATRPFFVSFTMYIICRLTMSQLTGTIPFWRSYPFVPDGWSFCPDQKQNWVVIKYFHG